MQDFQRFQLEFARHLRDPRRAPRPAGVPGRRMSVYTELLFNNVTSFLDRCLPVCRSVLGEERWRRLQRRFWREAPLQSPLHRDIPRDFARWLQAGGGTGLPRWLPELAHYEWVELAVDLMDADVPAHRADGDLMREPVLLNPAHMNLSYVWPVHRIGATWRPRREQRTQLLVWRDANDTVQFMALSAVTARLLTLLAHKPMTGENACHQLAAELQYPQPQQLLQLGAVALEDLRAQQVVLGTLGGNASSA